MTLPVVGGSRSTFFAAQGIPLRHKEGAAGLLDLGVCLAFVLDNVGHDQETGQEP